MIYTYELKIHLGDDLRGRKRGLKSNKFCPEKQATEITSSEWRKARRSLRRDRGVMLEIYNDGLRGRLTPTQGRGA